MITPNPVASAASEIPLTPVPSTLTPFELAQLYSWQPPSLKPPKDVWEVIGKYYCEYLRLDEWLAQFQDSRSALASAAENGQLAEARYALAAGAYVDAFDGYPLRNAAKNGHAEVVALLLAAGADVDAGTEHEASMGALQPAALNNHVEVVKLLLEAGADVHAGDDLAIRHAAENGLADIVELLLKAGADAKACHSYALRWAASNGHVKVVELLLAAEADVDAYHGCAIGWASERGHDEVVGLLQAAINARRRADAATNADGLSS